MNGMLAQMIALATHGSTWLRDIEDMPAPALDDRNSTFRYVRSVNFAKQQTQDRQVIADSVDTWLRQLRDHGVSRLWLAFTSAVRASSPGLDPRLEVAFANTGGWVLVGTGAANSTAWAAAWSVGDRGRKDRRIWEVAYTGVSLPGPVPIQLPVPAEARAALIEVLGTARTFAVANQLAPWDEWFAKTIEQFEATTPEIPYHPDMLPTHGYSQDSRRLAAAAVQAWVFGGMGSWTDISLEDPAAAHEYQRISRRLYEAVLTCLLAATNSDTLSS